MSITALHVLAKAWKPECPPAGSVQGGCGSPLTSLLPGATGTHGLSSWSLPHPALGSGLPVRTRPSYPAPAAFCPSGHPRSLRHPVPVPLTSSPLLLAGPPSSAASNRRAFARTLPLPRLLGSPSGGAPPTIPTSLPPPATSGAVHPSHISNSCHFHLHVTSICLPHQSIKFHDGRCCVYTVPGT